MILYGRLPRSSSATSQYVWTERYDGNLDDVFALQDDITEKIVSALSVKLTTAEEVRRGSE